MTSCLIYDQSLRFSRTVYGLMTLTAFLLHSFWLVLATSIFMLIGVFIEKYNLFYQLHSRFNRRFRKDIKPVLKDSGEISFACGMGGSFLLIGFFLLYFTDWSGLAWGLVLMTSMFMFLAGLGGICTASLLYALFKRMFKNGKKQG